MMSSSTMGIVLLVLLGLIYFAEGRKVFVAAPNTLRLDAEETVVITVAEFQQEVEVYSLYLEDFPARKSRFSTQDVKVHNGISEIAKVNVKEEDLPDIKDDEKEEPRYVFLVVTGNGVTKEVKLRVSSQSDHLFIQTDKPIYTPQEDVNIRIIPLNERLLPKDGKFKLQIRNPQDIIVEERVVEHQWGHVQPLFPVQVFRFPPRPLLGEWSIVALYGHRFQMNSTVHFQVDEYVLPNFVVTLEVPNVILPGDENVQVHASAKYVYGKVVKGTALFKLGVKHKLGNIIEIGRSLTKILMNGAAALTFSVDEIMDDERINAFPVDSVLFVEVEVVDTSTGRREKAVNEECAFANSPYEISFKRSQRDFKPGLVSVVMADVTYKNGQPAKDVPTSISVVDDKGNLIKVTNPMYKSDKDGHVFYTINTPIGSKTFTVKIKTNDPRYKEDQQYTGIHVLTQFEASGGYVAISRLEGTRIIGVGSSFSAIVVSQPAKEIHDIFYLVISRGRIVSRGALSRDRLLHRELQFQVSAEMAPSIRIVVFGLFRDELVADAIRVEVEQKCDQDAEVKIETQFPRTEPGHEGSFLLTGHRGTRVGILAVDSAVYALRDKDRLTKDKLFKTLEKDDLGCGPGGGLNTELVLANAGVVVFGNFKYLIKENGECAERLRRKREAVDKMVNEHPFDSRRCCRLAFVREKHHRSCEERAEIVRNFTNESDDGNCTKTFLKCCQKITSDGTVDARGRAVGNDDVLLYDFVEDLDREERQAQVRKDFRETWLFQDLLIGPEGTEKVSTNLPHSITTWIIQAVSVSDQFGMCVSNPKELVSFKSIFIDVNLPYAVVQNEQIEIQATIFNYFKEKVPVIVYMYGVEDLCTGVQPREKSERRRIIVDGLSTVTVGFPVVPLKVKEYTIRVVALSQAGHDVIERKLRVVAGGVLSEETISVVLDPTNQKNRVERDVITETVTDTIDSSQQLQLTSITLRPSKDFIPGTESCVISATGDEFGPTIETAVQNPESLLRKPVGCGEQTMMFMGPTVYTLNYLKVKGKITPELEKSAYAFVREGYNRELTFRKNDGSYAAWQNRASSTWLTAFVMKIFCQSSKYIFIDPNVICSGMEWLIQQQNADGSFTESHPIIHWDMLGGLAGAVPMTAFVLISLQHCTCENIKALQGSKIRAQLYLEGALPEVNDPYSLSLVSYALALSDSNLKFVANEKLQNAAIFDEGLNQRHWSKDSKSHAIETTAYALLAQIALGDMLYSIPIVNWLNVQRLAAGVFPSTQDTVVALHALSEYQIRAQSPEIDLHCNVTYSNDKALSRTLRFHNDNANVLQEFELEKIGGIVFFRTSGKGVGTLSVTLRYNVPHPVERLCKFDLTVNISEAKPDVKPAVVNGKIEQDFFKGIPDGLIRALDYDDYHEEFREGDVKFEDDQENVVPDGIDLGVKAKAEEGDFDRDKVGEADQQIEDKNAEERGKAEGPQKANSKMMLHVNICARYISDKTTDMAIIEAGIFTGFKPDMEDLKKLVEDEYVDNFEMAGRGIIFYLNNIPVDKPVCLKFRITREFVVGAVQPTVVKAYDYYNVDEVCTVFYSPDSNSALLRTICEDSVCQCAEGGCPPKEPFGNIADLQKARNLVLLEACEEHDYVWKGRVESVQKKDGFIRIAFKVERVLKPGAEQGNLIEGLTKTFLLQDTCTSFVLIDDEEYLIMGNDGERFEDKETKELQYRYLIDKSTIIHHWVPIRNAPNKVLQKALKWLETQLNSEDACRS